jgi:SAM-dependent methyltransferase
MVTRVYDLPPGVELRYGSEVAKLPSLLRDRFVELELGTEGRDFVERAVSTLPGKARTALQRTLRTFMSDFDANGLLDMYPMHLLSTDQWRSLVGTSSVRHLDVGAGSGDVTRTISPLARETVTTETSRMMARTLRRRGFRCFRTDVAEFEVPEPRYDLITCLNVLDRCARPLSLLSKLANALEPAGTLVVATPFPFDPFFYDGPASIAPMERLDLSRDGWERSVTALADLVTNRLGLSIASISRVPYLCQGDSDRPLYVLDDALLVCRRQPG